ncbi:HNH endonuclease family protein [Streptomyces sp. ALI-76-A]|uniref:HNH endonuclease family protein n=1 Tax=Streptomyces sp. ALI-76-A TaxID=3025736 RepID=UPI00256F42B0|nr:HNH endonuclease family protein [Streptomyces sp. ALI-76-A]MDL5202027.1 HNH endonuclease family protein [Streptomyces sp. ALI-76-A]
MTRLRGGTRSAVMTGAVACAAMALIAGCEGLDTSGSAPESGAAAPAPDGRSVSPLRNPDGTKPGLAPVASETDEATARKLIESLRTKGRGPQTGYDRDEFGYAWMDTADNVPLARNGCDTRNDLLQRDGQSLRFRSGSDCVVIAMTLRDPYTGTTIQWRKQDASEVQIDHVVPLSYSWQMGSSRWSEDKREQLANDPLNLIPAEGRANSAKGDSGPASWLPPNKQIRCAYVVRFAQVAAKYEMPVTAPDQRMMLKQCGG